MSLNQSSSPNPFPPRKRTRLITTSFRTPSPSIWLDLLPANVCEAISQYVLTATPASESPTDLINLAQTTPYQWKALLAILPATADFRSFDYLCPYSDQEPIVVIIQRRWAQLLKGRLSHLQIKGNCTRQVYLLPLLCARGIKTASILAEPTLLSTLSKSVKDLSLVMDRDVDEWKILTGLASWNELKSLHLSCQVAINYYGQRQCPFEKDEWVAKLGRVLKGRRLESLRITCMCKGGNRDRLWRVLPAVESVKEVCVESMPPKSLSDRVAGMRQVSILNMRNAFRFIPNVASVLRELKLESGNLDFIGEREFLILKSCHELRVLQIPLASEVTQGVDKVVHAMPCLETLRLRWCCGGSSTDGLYAGVKKGMLMEAVKNAPTLKDLALTNVCIELCELYEILEHMGDRLERFETSFWRQEEPGEERALLLLTAIVKWNHGMIDFVMPVQFDGEQGHGYITPWGGDGLLTPFGHQFRALIARLHKSAPRCLLDPDMRIY